VSARGLSPTKEKVARRSYRTLRAALMKEARLRKALVKRRAIIVPEEPEKGKKVETPDVAAFGTPSAVAHLEIKAVPSTTGAQPQQKQDEKDEGEEDED
jgi:hypothetical protein